jgi:hypothetical protein
MSVFAALNVSRILEAVSADGGRERETRQKSEAFPYHFHMMTQCHTVFLFTFAPTPRKVYLNINKNCLVDGVSEETSSRCDVEFAFLKMGWELLKLLKGKEKSSGKLLKRAQT